ncbi:MAG: hypothetical protein N4A37_04255 [Prolixibacteraceae bacterium]|jgi:transposase InsO family protein|nr:hypothetical protein [Prolixibacteraceae bacterium]
MSEYMTAENTVMKAWKMAKRNRKPIKNMLFHSGQGSQYVSNDLPKELTPGNVIQSMSRKGNYWDNVVEENFFKIIKLEMIDYKQYYSISQAKTEIFQFLEV